MIQMFKLPQSTVIRIIFDPSSDITESTITNDGKYVSNNIPKLKEVRTISDGDTNQTTEGNIEMYNQMSMCSTEQ